jgi:hypothetical protein
LPEPHTRKKQHERRNNHQPWMVASGDWPLVTRLPTSDDAGLRRRHIFTAFVLVCVTVAAVEGQDSPTKVRPLTDGGPYVSLSACTFINPLSLPFASLKCSMDIILMGSTHQFPGWPSQLLAVTWRTDALRANVALQGPKHSFTMPLQESWF